LGTGPGRARRAGSSPAEQFHDLRDFPTTAPLAPCSGPFAATLRGGLRPGSLHVHAPCKEDRHGPCLGFPGRRLPRGPSAIGNVARDLQVLLRNTTFVRTIAYLLKGEGGGVWTRRNLICVRPGSHRRSGAQAGVAVLLPYDLLGAEVQNFARSTRGIVAPRKTQLPAPFAVQARVRWAYFTLIFLVPIPGKVTTTFISSPTPIRSRILPTPHSGCRTRTPGW